MKAADRSHGGPDTLGVPVHDFSTNANACGPCPQALAAVQAADAARYPDPAYARLRDALAAFHGVDRDRIVPAGSASEFIFRVTAWAAQRGVRDVAMPPHCYGDYAQAAAAWKLRPAPEAGLTWACEPSSPLGQQQERIAPGAAIVVLDRAYEPLRLSGACSMSDDALSRLWQLWSPNKALGLTGVRAAYAIAPADDAAAAAGLEALAPSWPIGAHGVAMLLSWCEPAVQHWLAQSRDVLREWKARQEALCEEMRWTVLPADANFFVVRAADLARSLPALRRRGIKLRDCASFGLPGHVRLGVQAPAAQDALRRAWLEQEATA
jgi:histidinol-phosphate aminotransferase